LTRAKPKQSQALNIDRLRNSPDAKLFAHHLDGPNIDRKSARQRLGERLDKF
jgi:hypothetical protein